MIPIQFKCQWAKESLKSQKHKRIFWSKMFRFYNICRSKIRLNKFNNLITQQTIYQKGSKMSSNSPRKENDQNQQQLHESSKTVSDILATEGYLNKSNIQYDLYCDRNSLTTPEQFVKSNNFIYKRLLFLLLGIVILLLLVFISSTVYEALGNMKSNNPKDSQISEKNQEAKNDVQMRSDDQQQTPIQPVQQLKSESQTQQNEEPQIRIELPQSPDDQDLNKKGIKKDAQNRIQEQSIIRQSQQEKKTAKIEQINQTIGGQKVQIKIQSQEQIKESQKNSTFQDKLKTQFESKIQQKPQKEKEQQSVFIKQQEQTVKTQEEQKKEAKKNFSLRQRSRAMNLKIDEKVDCYEFSASIENVIAKSGISTTYRNEFEEWVGIKQSEYARAIRLMEVVHNVNFKGEFIFDHFNFYPSAEAKYQALLKVLEEEKSYYDEKYQISKYIHDQIGICVYVPSYNNAQNRLYLRNLDSIFQQEYQNYHVVYVNDASTDGTGDYVKAYMNENGIPAQKYAVIDNDKNKEDCGNFYMVVRDYCSDGQIMVFLDGQDSLIGRQVFSLLNAVYQKQKVALTYGQYLNVQGNKVHSGTSLLFPSKYLEDGNFRQLTSFYTSHLKTAYVDLLKLIRKQDLQDKNGYFYEYGADVAIMTPAIELAGTRMKFLSQLNYETRYDSGFHEPHDLRNAVQNQVFQKEPLQSIQDMSFADYPIKKKI